MKKIILSSLFGISLVLITQFIYVQTTSKNQLIELVNTIKKDSNGNQSFIKEESTLDLGIGVLDIKTGYYPSNLWYPSAIVKFQNNSNKNISEYLKAKAIFIDNSTNEQIGAHNKYLSTTNETFTKGTSLRKQFKSDLGYRGSTQNLNIL